MEGELRNKPPVIFGIKREDFTPELLQDIYAIYSEVAGINLPDYAYPVDSITKILDKGRAADFRYGSRIDSNSKFGVRITHGPDGQPLLRFSLSANLHPRDRKTELGDMGRKMEEDFTERVNKYLQAKGLSQKTLY